MNAEKMQKAQALEDDRGIPTQPQEAARPDPARGKVGASGPNVRGNKMQPTQELDAHCRKPGCNCGHVICYRGWIDTLDKTSPCQYCRADLHERWLMSAQARQKGYPLEACNRILGKARP